MNRAITTYYKEMLCNECIPMDAVKEAIYTAIRTEDTHLLELSLSKLAPDEDNWDKNASPIIFALREMASCDIIRILIEHGYKLPFSPDLLPWNGSPEDIISLMMNDNGKNKEEVFSYFMYSLCYYLEVIKTDYSGFSVPFSLTSENIYNPCLFSYLNNWLSAFASFLDNEVACYNYNGKDIALLIARIAQYSELGGALKTFIDSPLFDRSNIGWYLKRAVHEDNEIGFNILSEIADEDDFKKITIYPKSNMNILNKLFERNILIPGTDEAYEAFYKYIALREIDEEEECVLRAIMHHSYGNRRDKHGWTILMRAIHNKDFEPYLYPVLVTSTEELNARDNEGRTALYYLAKSGYPECIKILTGMGTIPFCVDEKGDNVLHVLLSGNKMNTIYDIEYCMGFLPKCLITMKNAEGKTPLDIFRDRLYESKPE